MDILYTWRVSPTSSIWTIENNGQRYFRKRVIYAQAYIL